jgi:hypothetical protein
MDTCWPQLVRAEFQPGVGKPLMNFIDKQFNSIQPDGLRDEIGSGFFEGSEMDVQQDLRQVLHEHVAGASCDQIVPIARPARSTSRRSRSTTAAPSIKRSR